MAIFKNKLFTKLFLASFASQLGTTIGNVAFAFYLLEHFSKKPFYATIAELMYSLPIVFVFFLVGVAADRLDRKKIALNSDWIRAGLTVVLLAAVYYEILWLVVCDSIYSKRGFEVFCPSRNEYFTRGTRQRAIYAGVGIQSNGDGSLYVIWNGPWSDFLSLYRDCRKCHRRRS